MIEVHDHVPPDRNPHHVVFKPFRLGERVAGAEVGAREIDHAKTLTPPNLNPQPLVPCPPRAKRSNPVACERGWKDQRAVLNPKPLKQDLLLELLGLLPVAARFCRQPCLASPAPAALLFSFRGFWREILRAVNSVTLAGICTWMFYVVDILCSYARGYFMVVSRIDGVLRMETTKTLSRTDAEPDRGTAHRGNFAQRRQHLSRATLHSGGNIWRGLALRRSR